MKTPFAIRQAIYSLDPNRHFSADIPFQDYLLSVIARSSVGIPVPEGNIELFRHLVRFCTRSFFSELPPLDASWIPLAERLARMVRDILVSPLPVTVDEEEAWRKKIFTYPPGRYAILKSGARLARLAAAPTSELLSWAQSFPGSRNPFDCLIASALRDAWDLPDNEAEDLDSLLWSPTKEAFQAASNGKASKLRALLASGLNLGEIRADGKTLGQHLFAEASKSLSCLQLLKKYEPK
jgi:hypothetical protein